VPDEYAWRNPTAEQICLLSDQPMPDHEGAIVIPEFADSSWNLSPLKFLCDGCVSYRLALSNFVNQAFGRYADEGVLGAAQEFFFVSEML